MSYKDIQKKDDKALMELVKDKREAVRSFRFSSSGSSLRDVRQVRTDKREVARALTELNARLTASKAQAGTNAESSSDVKKNDK